MLRDNQFKCKRCKITEKAENSDMEKVFLDGQAIEVVQRFGYEIRLKHKEEPVLV